MLLNIQNISKTFHGVKALQDVHLQIEAGKVHAICGENGAGKSTLMNILGGHIRPDAGGLMSWKGNHVQLDHSATALSMGIAAVQQDRYLIPDISVAENIFFSLATKKKSGWVSYKQWNNEAAKVLKELGLSDISPQSRITELTPAEAQMVAIARTLAQDPELLILDEPTACLTEREVKILYQLVKKLKTKGVAIIYISHRLKEIFDLADVVTVLKDGRLQATLPITDVNEDELVKLMVGRLLPAYQHHDLTVGEKLLELKSLSANGFSEVSLELFRGEILGIAGLAGAGRTALAHTIFGYQKVTSGEIIFKSEPVHFSHPAQAIAKGIAYLTEDRKPAGIFPDMTLMENITTVVFTNSLQKPWISWRTMQEMATKWVGALGIVTSSIQKSIRFLSGGNQQKAVLARWLMQQPSLLMADEPTQGVDVGAKLDIHQLLRAKALEGMGILLISSELPELLALSHRIIVLSGGRITGTLNRTEATEEKLLSLMMQKVTNHG